jgi:hypothetical protein
LVQRALLPEVHPDIATHVATSNTIVDATRSQIATERF